MSWAGKILRVNLTAGTVKSEPLNMEWAKACLLYTSDAADEMD
jgi:aldehyde:ferredoxin oxidoreductase